jgi:hypothetical protein
LLVAETLDPLRLAGSKKRRVRMDTATEVRWNERRHRVDSGAQKPTVAGLSGSKEAGPWP